MDINNYECYSVIFLSLFCNHEIETITFVAGLNLKGEFGFFEVGSYKVHIYSQSVLYCNHRSAQPQFGEVERLRYYGREQIDYRYVLYMTPHQKTRTIPLSQSAKSYNQSDKLLSLWTKM